MRTQARYEVGATAELGGTLRDGARLPIPYSNLNELILTLKDAATGQIVNHRENQDVKNTNNVQVDTGATGAFIWSIQKADLTPLDSLASYSEYIASLRWRFNSNEWGEHEHRLQLRNFTRLCTLQDVLAIRGNVDPNEYALVEAMIDAISLRIENITSRLFLKSTEDAPTTEILSVYSDDCWSLPVKRWPVDQIISVNQQIEGRFTDSMVIPSSDYTLNGDKNRIRMRYYPFFYGPGSVQLVYAGGLASDPGAVPFDLRMAVARQATYWHQSKDKMGILSVSMMGASQTLRMEQDFLADVRAVVENYSAIWP